MRQWEPKNQFHCSIVHRSIAILNVGLCLFQCKWQTTWCSFQMGDVLNLPSSPSLVPFFEWRSSILFIILSSQHFCLMSLTQRAALPSTGLHFAAWGGKTLAALRAHGSASPRVQLGAGGAHWQPHSWHHTEGAVLRPKAECKPFPISTGRPPTLLLT